MNNERTGNFTSSNIAALTKNGRAKDTYGAPFYTLVEEKAMEVVLNRGINNDSKAAPTDWGHLCELFAFELLPLEYTHNTARYNHLTLPWKGIPDFIGDEVVGDIKCPFTLKSAFKLALCKSAQEIKETDENYYWQLVSNGVLTNKSKAELVIFVPSIKRADDIIQKAQEVDSLVKYRTVNELPFLPEESLFPELTKISFDIPQEDKEFLSERVQAAIEIRNEYIENYKKSFGL